MKLHPLAVGRANLGLADARRMLPAPKHSADCKVWSRRNNGLELFFMVRSSSLNSIEGKTLQHTMKF
jgi:hypothetical protein